MPALLHLDEKSCRTLLQVNIVGRVGFVQQGTPRIVPVNYAMDGADVVVAVDPSSELGRVVAGSDPDAVPVAVFEIDHVDHDRHQGWSVTVTGPMVEVRDSSALQRRAPGSTPRPWADGDHPMLVRVVANRVSGRRLGTDWGRPDDVPVRRHL